MTAKRVAWGASVLFVVVLLSATLLGSFFLWEREQYIEAFRSNDLLYSKVDMRALQALEDGQVDLARDLMIQGVFVGLTRAYPEQETLANYHQRQLSELAGDLLDYRERNPGRFDEHSEWWLARVDNWASDWGQE